MLRRPRLLQFPLWLSILMIALALGIIASLFLYLRRDSISTDTAADRVFRSALLPDDWKTFGADVWSIGYPGDWEVTSRNSTIALEGGGTSELLPKITFSSGDDEYLIVTEVSLSPSEIEALFEEGSIKEKSEFYFAGYPAAKYTAYDGSEMHVISYEDRVFTIETETPDDGSIGIMLATFQFFQ